MSRFSSSSSCFIFLSTWSSFLKYNGQVVTYEPYFSIFVPSTCFGNLLLPIYLEIMTLVIFRESTFFKLMDMYVLASAISMYVDVCNFAYGSSISVWTVLSLRISGYIQPCILNPHLTCLCHKGIIVRLGMREAIKVTILKHKNTNTSHTLFFFNFDYLHN